MNNALQLAWMRLLGLLLMAAAAAPAQASTVELAIIRYTPEPGRLLLAGLALIAIGVAMKKTQRKV